MVNSSITGRKVNGNREVYFSQVLEEVHRMPCGATLGGQDSAERERQDLGCMPLLGSMGGVFWSSQAKARFVNSV